MNRKMIARELVLVAKNLIAEDKDGYVYDPDHKNKPKGGGWEKTDKGWTQNKREDSKSESSTPKEKCPHEVDFAFRMYVTDKAKNWRLGLSAVSDRKCPNAIMQDTIEDLAKHVNGPFGDVDTRFHFHYAISKNPNSSSETLDKLYDAASGDANYLKYDDALNLLKHKNTSGKTVNKIVSDYMEYPEDDKYGKRRDRRNVLLPAISNQKISTGNLATLAEDKDTFVKRNARKKLAERANQSIDLSKLSPELREKVKGMSPEELGKFLGWLKKRKNGGGVPVEEESEL